MLYNASASNQQFCTILFGQHFDQLVNTWLHLQCVYHYVGRLRNQPSVYYRRSRKNGVHLVFHVIVSPMAALLLYALLSRGVVMAFYAE